MLTYLSYQKNTFLPVSTGRGWFVLLFLLVFPHQVFAQTAVTPPSKQEQIHITVHDGVSMVHFPEEQSQAEPQKKNAQEEPLVYVTSGAQIINISQESEFHIQKLLLKRKLPSIAVHKPTEKTKTKEEFPIKQVASIHVSKIKSPISEQKLKIEYQKIISVIHTNHDNGCIISTDLLPLKVLHINKNLQQICNKLYASSSATALRIRPPPLG